MSIFRYERYKESGVAWLGDVPTHWDTLRLRILVEIKKRIAGELGHDILSITQQGIRIKDTDSNEGQLALDYSKYQLVEPGDFAMNHMDLLTGFVDLASMHGVTSPDYRVFSVRPGIVCSKRYLLYVFQNAYRQRIFYAFGQGSSHLGRWRLPTEEFNNFVIPFPSRDEQEQVAAFLDRETAKIDALIEKQRRLIALLKEKRRAVISHVVTKGLNSSAPMKDSGIAWLGRVPSEWELLPVWLLFELGRGRVISHEEIALNEGIYPVYSSQTENDGQMGTINTYDFDGDFLTWTTDGANAGTVFKRNGRFNCTNVCGTLKPKSDRLDLTFVCSVLNEATGYFVRQDINPKLMNNVMGGIRIPIPPYDEQVKIRERVESQMKRSNGLIEEGLRLVELLQERRSTLISAAVTGKIDVRGLAANTSEMFEAAYEPA